MSVGVRVGVGHVEFQLYLIGQLVVSCGIVLPVCLFVVSFSKFHEPDAHLLRTYSRGFSRGWHEENASVEFQLYPAVSSGVPSISLSTCS